MVASLANGFIMTPPEQNPLLRWLQEYKFYQPVLHEPFSTMKIMALAQRFPGEIQIVQRKWIVPNYLKKLKVFFGREGYNGGRGW